MSIRYRMELRTASFHVEQSVSTRIFLNIISYLNFACRIFGAHIADRAEYGPFWPPGMVVAAEAPENPVIGVRIAAVKGVPIIQLDHDFERLLRRARPLQNLLPPEHAQVVVNAPLANQLALRRIPERIVGVGCCKFFQRINVPPLVVRVFGQSLPRPIRQCVEPIAFGMAVCFLEPKFAPRNQLVEECLSWFAQAPPT